MNLQDILNLVRQKTQQIQQVPQIIQQQAQSPLNTLLSAFKSRQRPPIIKYPIPQYPLQREVRRPTGIIQPRVDIEEFLETPDWRKLFIEQLRNEELTRLERNRRWNFPLKLQ